MNRFSRTVILAGDAGVPIVFSVPPLGMVTETRLKMKNIDILGYGEVVFPGNRRAERVSFETFLPSTDSPFYKPLLNPLPPFAIIEILKKWQATGEELSLIIPETAKWLYCYIDEFTVIEKDFTNDQYIKITLVETRDYNVRDRFIADIFRV